METLIKASEAKKYTERYEDNFLADTDNRIGRTIEEAIRNISLNVKLCANKGVRSTSYIGNKEIQGKFSRILTEHGYSVTSRFIGTDRVEFIIKW